MKISYYAWKAGKSVFELLLEQIYKSFQELNQHRAIKKFNIDYFVNRCGVQEMMRQLYKVNPAVHPEDNSATSFNANLVSTSPCLNINEKSQKILDDYLIRLDLNKRLGRVVLILVLIPLGLINVEPHQQIELMLEREKLIKEHFIHCLGSQNEDYFRIPKQLTQERLPLGFAYYNCLLPLINDLAE